VKRFGERKEDVAKQKEQRERVRRGAKRRSAYENKSVLVSKNELNASETPGNLHLSNKSGRGNALSLKNTEEGI